MLLPHNAYSAKESCKYYRRFLFNIYSLQQHNKSTNMKQPFGKKLCIYYANATYSMCSTFWERDHFKVLIHCEQLYLLYTNLSTNIPRYKSNTLTCLTVHINYLIPCQIVLPPDINMCGTWPPAQN